MIPYPRHISERNVTAFQNDRQYNQSDKSSIQERQIATEKNNTTNILSNKTLIYKNTLHKVQLQRQQSHSTNSVTFIHIFSIFFTDNCRFFYKSIYSNIIIKYDI